MRNPGGWAIMIDGDIKVERDTVTCNHCNHILHINPRMRPEDQNPFRVIEADTCKMCMRHVCPLCQAAILRGEGCAPFEKKIEQHEQRVRLRKASEHP